MKPSNYNSNNSTGYNHIISLVCLIFILQNYSKAQQQPQNEELSLDVKRSMESITADEMIIHTRHLCQPKYQGRRAGTEGDKKASDYICEEFRKIGLLQGGTAGSYYQRFKIMPGYKISGQMSVEIGSISVGDLHKGQNYMPVHIPGNKASINSDCVLAGYGLTIPKMNFDEYNKINVKGKTVIVFSGLPWDLETQGWLKNMIGEIKYNSITYKANNAASHGAVCMLLVDNPAGWRKKLAVNEQLRLPELNYPMDSRIPVIHITRELLASIMGMSIEEIRLLAGDISREYESQSMILAGRRLSLDISLTGSARLGRNIIGILPGRDPELRRQAVILGAHYDHLGADSDEIFFGANDNAAGVSAVLQNAEAFRKLNQPVRRTVIFICFDAEEIGKMGSKYYVNNPSIPIDNTALMINFDMIAKNEPDEIFVVASRSSPELHKIHLQMNEHVGLKLVHPESYRLGRSDHTAFFYAGIPVMYFFGGLDADYNTPGDTVEKLVPQKMEKVARLAFLTAYEVAENKKKITFSDSTSGL